MHMDAIFSPDIRDVSDPPQVDWNCGKGHEKSGEREAQEWM